MGERRALAAASLWLVTAAAAGARNTARACGRNIIREVITNSVTASKVQTIPRRFMHQLGGKESGPGSANSSRARPALLLASSGGLIAHISHRSFQPDRLLHYNPSALYEGERASPNSRQRVPRRQASVRRRSQHLEAVTFDNENWPVQSATASSALIAHTGQELGLVTSDRL